jgi:hypothetical protein
MLTNHHEYYSAHYFAELLAGDLRETLERWRNRADQFPDSEAHREPPARLRSLAQPYFRALEKIRRTPDSLAEIQRDFFTSLLPALGYSLSPSWRARGQGSNAVRIPLIGEVTTQSGEPALWIIETLPIVPPMTNSPPTHFPSPHTPFNTPPTPETKIPNSPAFPHSKFNIQHPTSLLGRKSCLKGFSPKKNHPSGSSSSTSTCRLMCRRRRSKAY